MKKVISFITVVTILSLVLGSFLLTPAAKQSAATTPAQSAGVASIPDLSPFFFAASAPIISMGVEPPGEMSASSPAGYSCQYISQVPKDWTEMKKRQIFDTTWVLRNTGTKVWGIHGVDVRYRGDTRMHTNVPDLFDIPKRVAPGQKFEMTIDMVAPKQPGYYVSNWGLYLGSQVFCKFYVIIVVTK